MSETVPYLNSEGCMNESFAGITSDWISLEKESGKTILPLSLSSPACHLFKVEVDLQINVDHKSKKTNITPSTTVEAGLKGGKSE